MSQMVSAGTVSSLIALIYDAALDARRWPDFLAAFADAVGGSSTQILHHDVRDSGGTISTCIRLDPDARRKYDEYFVTIDPWISRGKATGVLRPGTVHIGEAIVPRSEMVKTEYYSDLARPYGVSRVLGAVIHCDDTTMSNLSSLRPDSREPFGESERRLAELLMPHLQRALQLHQRVAGLELASTAAMDALDRLQIGVIGIRKNGSIAFANRAASDILASRDGLTASSRGLAAATVAETRALRALVRGATATSAGTRTDAAGGAMSISRPSLGRPLTVLVTPMRTQTLCGFAGDRGMAAVFVSDPERCTEADRDTLRRVWGLTRAEAEITARLARGQSLREIADQLAITDNTARWHVKRVMAKTETRRQAELVRILTASAAMIASRESHG